MTKKIVAFSLLSVALLATACGGAQSTNTVTKGQERSSGLFGMNKSDAVSVDTKEAFKAADKVVIGSFNVGFATYKTNSAKAGGGLTGGGFGGKSTAKSSLVGIDDKLMQQITDEAYKQFVDGLKAKGYTVVDRKELLANKSFADTKTYPNPYEDSNGGIFGASSKTKYFAPSSFGAIRVFLGDIPGVTGGFGFSNPAMAASQYAKDSGVKVLNVVYVVDYANAESYGGWATSSSAVTVGQGITIVPEYSRMGIIGGDGGTFSTNNGAIKLGQPINSDKEFATVENTNSEAYKAVEVAANVVGILGGVGSNSSREYEFKARPNDYKAGALEVVKKVNTTFVDTMAGLK